MTENLQRGKIDPEFIEKEKPLEPMSGGEGQRGDRGGSFPPTAVAAGNFDDEEENEDIPPDGERSFWEPRDRAQILIRLLNTATPSELLEQMDLGPRDQSSMEPLARALFDLPGDPDWIKLQVKEFNEVLGGVDFTEPGKEFLEQAFYYSLIAGDTPSKLIPPQVLGIELRNPRREKYGPFTPNADMKEIEGSLLRHYQQEIQGKSPIFDEPNKSLTETLGKRWNLACYFKYEQP